MSEILNGWRCFAKKPQFYYKYHHATILQHYVT